MSTPCSKRPSACWSARLRSSAGGSKSSRSSKTCSRCEVNKRTTKRRNDETGKALRRIAPGRAQLRPRLDADDGARRLREAPAAILREQRAVPGDETLD